MANDLLRLLLQHEAPGSTKVAGAESHTPQRCIVGPIEIIDPHKTTVTPVIYVEAPLFVEGEIVGEQKWISRRPFVLRPVCAGHVIDTDDARIIFIADIDASLTIQRHAA